jgi:hypothetical protein
MSQIFTTFLFTHFTKVLQIKDLYFGHENGTR